MDSICNHAIRQSDNQTIRQSSNRAIRQSSNQMSCPPSDLKLDLKRITWGSHWRVIRSGHTGGQTGGGRIGEAPRVTRSGSHGDHMRGHTAGHTGGVTWGHMVVTWWSHGGHMDMGVIAPCRRCRESGQSPPASWQSCRATWHIRHAWPHERRAWGPNASLIWAGRPLAGQPDGALREGCA